jgi:hypothetical protein
VFLHPLGPAGHVMHSGASKAGNGDAVYSTLGWDRHGFNKKYDGTRYTKLLFLHLVGSVDHVVHSSGSRQRNGDGLFSWSGGTGMDSTKNVSGHVMPNLYFCILWDL